ncbi:MAG: hypothetical protein GYA16_04585 [Spirochaetes bacterium]|nr:hypothetical protein [Spirochaetota bacterium]
MMDDNGYPTEEELKKIQTWNVNSLEEYHKFMAYIHSLWHWPEYFRHDGDTYTLSTGGWSGNEDIIIAMASNAVFWIIYWEKSERGGLHVFSPMKHDAI